MEREEPSVGERALRKLMVVTLIIWSGSLLSGCVVMEEKYNAEKTRSLNFQRLLAQEERRTAELDSEVKRTKQELAEFEARNRELSGQVQSVREHMMRLQEETEAIKESALLERRAMEDMRRSSHPAAKPKPAVPPAQTLGEISGLESAPAKSPVDKGSEGIHEPGPAVRSGAMLHVVKPGETLFRISRRYGIEIEKLKKMNKLPDDIIEVGQKLVVGAE
jgi:outer membrane murein-binding lipoprotein Lpp